MFRGNATVNIDDKGRFAIPTRFRDRVLEVCGVKLVIASAVNASGSAIKDCLWVYPLPAWEHLEAEINKLPAFKPQTIQLKHVLVGGAFDCDMDAQGRIVLPEKLRKLSNLGKRLVLVGQINRMEIWNEDAWEAKELAYLSGGIDGGSELEPMEEMNSLPF